MMVKHDFRSVPRLVEAFNSFNTYMGSDLFGGRKKLKPSWVINSHKILTPFVVLGLMVGYQNFSSAAWLYLSLHGSYCVCWLLKHLAFRDPKWETKVTLGGAIFTFIILATYWLAPFLLISGLFYTEPRVLPNWVIATSVALVVIGTTLMIASDCQKRYTLTHRPGLITDGLFSVVRHPNYLGEMMVYSGFALTVGLIWPWLVLAYLWFTFFLVNMYMIEVSLSRYPEWRGYKARTGMILPKIFTRSNRAA
jgi:protein-S-isoprenylcysteine O-methyltransferase Ste14